MGDNFWAMIGSALGAIAVIGAVYLIVQSIAPMFP